MSRFTLVALVLLSAVTGCATNPSRTRAVGPAQRLTVEINSPEITEIDPETVALAFTVIAANPGKSTAVITSATAEFSIAGIRAAEEQITESSFVEPDKAIPLEFRFQIHLPDLAASIPELRSASDAKWGFEATLSTHLPDGSAREETAATSGTFPIVRPPTIGILALRIERYDLIETKLKLTLAVGNPNSFALAFKSIKYLFSADGRTWGNGEADVPAPIAPRGTTRVDIPMTLNFIEMGRKLVDVVATLGVVQYRLEATTRVATPFAAIPVFSTDFDQNGAIKVEK